MSHNVYVDDTLVFGAEAKTKINTIGPVDSDKIFKEYNFRELLMNATNDYTVELDTDSTIAVGSGGAVFTTLATDTRVANLGIGAVRWYPASSPIVEMKFKISLITTVAIYAGFNDAATEASTYLPHGITSSTHTATATDSAGFLFDTLQTLKYFNVVNSLAAGSAKAFTQLASTYVPVADTYITIRVAIDTSGNARYWYNGVPVGYKATAVTSTTPLVPFFGIRNNGAAAHVGTLRYVRVWCDA